MEEQYIELFTSIYTVDELKGIVTFYRSPIGKSMIEKQPLVIQKAMEISQNALSLLLPEIEKMTREFSASIEAK